MKQGSNWAIGLGMALAMLLAAAPAKANFTFGAWADTKADLSDTKVTLAQESKEMSALNPAFTIYPGDLCDAGISTCYTSDWSPAMNGNTNNGMEQKTFVTRGNHDGAESETIAGGWLARFDIRGVAGRLCTGHGGTWNAGTGICTGGTVGAINYKELSQDLTYSFDYENTHFAGVDLPDGDVDNMSAAQMAWLDQDLTAAESRGLTHAFLFWHGPVYPIGSHCCNSNPSLNQILDKHPIVSAVFPGHEHDVAYVHMDRTKYSTITHPYEQLLSGDAGAGPDSVNTSRLGANDWWLGDQDHGFMTIDVAGTSFTAKAFKMGTATPVKTWTFSKSVITPNPATPTPTTRPIASITPAPTTIPGSCQHTVVPAYFYPTESHWTNMMNTLKAGDIAIYNPGDGPGSSANSDYTTGVNEGRSKGIIMMGYVMTGWGSRAASAVKADIDKYYNWYRTVDIFLDEASTGTSDIPYYRDLYNYIKARGGKVMVNPGTIPDEQYMSVSDYAMIFESDYQQYTTATFPAWTRNYDSGRLAHLVYAASSNQWQNAMSLGKQRNAGLIYVTNDVLDNPWDTLPPYWSPEVAQLCNSNTTPQPTIKPTATPTGAAGKPGDANGDNKVDDLDYIIWARYYGTTNAAGPAQGDFNKDAHVDDLDYVIWANNYGK